MSRLICFVFSITLISFPTWAKLVTAVGICEAKGICRGNCFFTVTQIHNHCLDKTYDCPWAVGDQFTHEVCGEHLGDCKPAGTQEQIKLNCLLPERNDPQVMGNK